MNDYQVIIAGAGPVGLLIALRLGHANIRTLVLERHASILPTTRAVVYQPIVIPALKSLGFLADILQHASKNHDGIYWRDENGRELAHLPLGGAPNDDESFHGILLLGQQRLANLILSKLSHLPSVTVRWNTTVKGITHLPSSVNPTSVKVSCTDRTTHQSPTFTASWLLATDGSNSTTRNALSIPFTGTTYTSFKMIGADVYHDFKLHNFSIMNFIVHPEHWAVIIYCGEQAPDGKTPLYRVAFAVPADTADDHDVVMAIARERIARYARVEPSSLHISRAEPYTLQQRVADHGRVNRVLLAGDALHSNNPIGGLGLTSGIVDAASFSNALVRVIHGGEDDSLLTECAHARRDAWKRVTDPVSRINLRRLMASDEEAVQERDKFFAGLKGEEGRRTWGTMLRALATDLFEGKERVGARL